MVTKVVDDTYITPAPPYPSEGVFLLDENANVLNKNAEFYPAGTIKAYGFKAGDGNYYAVDVKAIPDELMWGGYKKLIESLPEIDSTGILRDYNGEHNTDEIIKALTDYNDGYSTGAPAAEACRARTFNGKQGFLPAFGQFKDFGFYKSEVNTLAAKSSLDVFETSNKYWTSTQYANDYSWSLNWRTNTATNSSRVAKNIVRAFFAL